MSADDVAIAFELAPPASPKARFLAELWDTVTTCENYELFPSLGVCSGLKKAYALLIGRHQETSGLFDNSLFIAFILVFFAFLVSSVYTIFVEERKSLKEISNKVRKTTDALISLLRAFWTLKEAKVNNLRMEVECKKVNKMKIPTYLFDSNLIKKFEGAAIVAFADITLPLKISKPDIFYTHEEEFPVESDWISLSRSPSEITSFIISDQLSFNNLRKEMSGPILRFPNIKEHNDIKDKRILRKRFEISSIMEHSSKTDFSSTALEAIPEAYSDGEDSLPTRKLSTKLPPPPKGYQLIKEKMGQQNLTNNAKPARNNGIFTERKKILKRVQRTKSLEKTELRSSMHRANKTVANFTKNSKVAPKKSGIFNKFKPQPQQEVLNRHKNI